MVKVKFSSAYVHLFMYFIGLSLFGSAVFQLPVLYVSGHAVPWIDGLFTTVSALCVTGLSSVDMGVYTGAGLAVLMLFIEAGGLGLITFFTFYLARPSRRISLVNRRFVKDFFIDDVEDNPRTIISRILIYTFAIQSAGALFLSCVLARAGENHSLFYGMFFSVSAFCNAGFAPYSDNMHRFCSNAVFCLIVVFLIITGGLGFTVMQDIAAWIFSRLQKLFCLRHHTVHLHRISFHSRIVLAMTAVLVTVPSVIFFFSDAGAAFTGMAAGTRFLNAFFQSITTRTAGFETVAQQSFSPLASFLSGVLMFIGGSPGSMAGGIKTTTVFLALCYAFRSQDDRNQVTVFNRDIPDSVISKAAGVIIKALLCLGLAVCIMCITEYRNITAGVFSFDTMVYEIISAFCTVGLSKGATPLLSCAGKAVIILTMLVGRTGVIAMSMAVCSTSNELKRVVDYPQEPVLVG